MTVALNWRLATLRVITGPTTEATSAVDADTKPTTAEVSMATSVSMK
jgi:hypothetical protein